MSETKGNCANWTAIHDFMPPEPARLTVRGTCTFPTTGYSVTLTKKVPQGINPLILLLDKKVTAPSGAAGNVVTTVEAVYKEVTSVNYKEVELSDGTKIKVQDVS